MWDFVLGFLQVCWMILQLLFTIVKALMGLGSLSIAAVRDAAHNLTLSVIAWVTSLLLLSPFSDTWLGGSGSLEQDSVSSMSALSGLQSAFGRGGMGSLPVIAIEAGMALTMIVFFYGFAESSVQLEKTNMQLILSRILRWIVAVGLVAVSYRLLAYLFMAFRSFYSLGGDISAGSSYDSIKSWFDNPDKGNLIAIKPPSKDGVDTSSMIDVQSIITTEMSEVPDVASGGMTDVGKVLSVRNGGVGTLIMFFGLVKLCKKAIKFVVEQVPAFIKVAVFFVFAPLGLAMYAAPETQQKANSYLRQFGGVVLVNLFKVIAITMSTALICRLAFPVGGTSYSILNTMPIVSSIFSAAFQPHDALYLGADAADLATEVAFLVTSGGLLGYQLYFDLVGKASEISERFAHEVMS